MKKILTALLMSLVLSGCTKLEKAYYSERLAELNMHRDEVKNGKYTLLYKEDVPLTEDEKRKIRDNYHRLKVVRDKFNITGANTDLEDELKERLAMKRYVESYYQVLSKGNKPTILLYAVVKLEKGSEFFFSDSLEEIRFDCYSNNDLVLKSISFSRKDDTDFLVLTGRQPHSLHGGQLVDALVIFPDDSGKEIKHYLPKEEAERRSYLDGLKKKVCEL